MDNQLAPITNQVGMIDPRILEKIQKLHKEVSALETPKNEVKKDNNGMDYVEMSYMRRIADEHFPGWSWNIINTRTHEVGELEVAFSVHGRLTWIDNGVIRQGDMVAGHANYTLKSGKNYVSVSNAWKSANTECMKKAFNTFMNIADDVYRNIDTKLTGAEEKVLLDMLRTIDNEWLEDEQNTDFEEMSNKILDGTINKENYKGAIAKLERWKKKFDLSKSE